MKERNNAAAMADCGFCPPEYRFPSFSSAADEKRNRRAGFTLAETLAAVLILLMVSAVVAAGIPAAVRAYEKVTRRANAEVLLSTSVSALRGRLGTARSVAVSDTAVTYYSTDTGSFSRIYPDPASGVLMVQEYILTDPVSGNGTGAGGSTGTGGSGTAAGTGGTGTGGSGTAAGTGGAGGGSGISGDGILTQLVTDSAATEDLYITYESVSVEKGILHIGNLRVRRRSSGEEITALQTLEIRIFSDIPADG